MERNGQDGLYKHGIVCVINDGAHHVLLVAGGEQTIRLAWGEIRLQDCLHRERETRPDQPFAGAPGKAAIAQDADGCVIQGGPAHPLADGTLGGKPVDGLAGEQLHAAPQSDEAKRIQRKVICSCGLLFANQAGSRQQEQRDLKQGDWPICRNPKGKRRQA